MELPKLVSEVRQEVGTKAVNRLRAGKEYIPGVLYGKKKENILLKAREQDVRKFIMDNQLLVELDIAGKKEYAMFKEIQWDLAGEYLIHFDLARVSLTDRVEASITLDFKGEMDAPGVKSGGMLEHLKTNVQIECPANEIPEHIQVDVSKLELNGRILFKDIELDPKFKLLDDPEDIVLICLPPMAEEEIAADAELKEASQKEPEVISEKEKEDKKE